MSRNNDKLLFWIPVGLPPLLLFIAVQMLGGDGLSAIASGARSAFRFLTVHRPKPSRDAIADGHGDSEAAQQIPARIGGLLGYDKSGEGLLLTIRVGLPGLKASAADGESDDAAEEDADGTGEIEGATPTLYLCRVDTVTGEIEWLSRDQRILTVYPDLDLTDHNRTLAWVSVPIRSAGDESSTDVIPAPPTLWFLDPERGPVPVHQDPALSYDFVLHTGGLAASLRTEFLAGWRSQILLRSPDSKSFAPPTAWNGVLDPRVHRFFAQGDAALASIRFPKIGGHAYTEFIEVDLATGEYLSTLDQANVRTIVANSFLSVTDDVFLVRCRDKARLEHAYGVISFYGTRPLHHIMDVDGLSVYPSREPGIVYVLDSSENILRRDRDSDIPGGRPVLRRVDYAARTAQLIDLESILPGSLDHVTYRYLESVWNSKVFDSPVSPGDELVLIPNESADVPSFIINTATGHSSSIPLDHPVYSFRWSPSGRFLALSSTSATPIRGRREFSRPMGLTRSEPEENSLAVPPVIDPADAATTSSLPITPRVTIWDHETGAIVDTLDVQAIPVRWVEDALVLIKYQWDPPFEPGSPVSLLYRYTAADGLKPLPESPASPR